MRFFCYGRKSVYSDRSESVENQKEMCLAFVKAKFPESSSFTFFSDEDFTGANTERPGLKEMLSRISEGEADALIVYQLDRLSRNVRDFSNIYEMLQEKGCKFISIKENIDTGTPIGRAMMYVTVVFAQMERETIAVRVDDNQRGIARRGWWFGGEAPVGYVRKSVTVDGRKHVTIVPDPEGVEYVKKIFNTFLSWNCSLQHMETEFKRQGIKTRRGKFFSTTQLHQILTMPYCVEATPEVYDYFAAKGCVMDPGSPREKWDGKHGVTIYGRTSEKSKKHEKQPPEKWLVCLGQQEPFIPAETWLAVQARFTHNKCIKQGKYPVPLLKGAIRCGVCGTLLQVGRRKRVDGSVYSYYYCRKRMREGPEACSLRMVSCETLDEKVLEILRGIAADPETIREYVSSESAAKAAPDPKAAAAKVVACKGKIDRLASSLGLAEGSSAQKYIIAELERLDLELAALQREEAAAKAAARESEKEAESSAAKAAEIAKFINGLDGFTPKERNEIVRKIVKRCTWDGETLFLML